MATGDGPGSRHHQARSLPAEWTCPSCHARNTTRFEDGCPGCGAGTAAANEAAIRAATAKKTIVADEKQIEQSLFDDRWDDGTTLGWDLACLNPMARRTLGRALASYADLVVPQPDELPTAVQLAWARRLLDEDS